MRRVAILSLLWLSAVAHAEGKGPVVDRSMVLLDFTPQTPDDAHRAEALTALVAARVQRHPSAKLVSSADIRSLLSVERQKQLMGCTEGSCMAELGGALGTRYIISGQVGRVGGQILLSASVVDARNARSMQRFAQTLKTEDELPQAATTLADGIADAVGLPAVDPPASGADRGFNLDVKLGNTLPVLTGQEQESLKALNLRIDLELGYFVTSQTSPFLGASVALANSSSGDTLRFIPVLLGVKHYFRPDSPWQPYVGGGLGLGFLAGKLTGDTSTNTSFAVTGIGGVAFIPWRHVGFNLEASANLSGVDVSGSGVLLTYNLDFGVLFLF